MKRSNHGTQLDDEPKHEKPVEPSTQTRTNPHDARHDEEQLAENRDELGVGEDHRTGDMKRGGRGTYP